MEDKGFVLPSVLPMNTSIEVVCYKYKPLKNNELTLKLRIIKGRKIKYISLGVSTKPEYWDFSKNQPKHNCPNKEYLERLISNKIAEYRSKVIELKSENKDFTATTLVEKVAKPIKAITVGELFQQHIRTLEEEKRIGYATSFKHVYKKLIKFNGHLDIYFSEINLSWLKRYEVFWRKEGRAENTIGIHLRTIRVIFNLAIEIEAVKSEHYPFKKYKVSKLHQQTAKRAITKEDVIQIINYNASDKDYYTQLAIDLFTYSYVMGGINFVDIAYLKWDNIVENQLVYIRRKTKKQIKFLVHELACMIHQKYNGNKYIFPILSDFHKTEQQKINRVHKVITKVNKSLKAVGEQLSIPVNLTT